MVNLALIILAFSRYFLSSGNPIRKLRLKENNNKIKNTLKNAILFDANFYPKDNNSVTEKL